MRRLWIGIASTVQLESDIHLISFRSNLQKVAGGLPMPGSCPGFQLQHAVEVFVVRNHSVNISRSVVVPSRFCSSSLRLLDVRVSMVSSLFFFRFEGHKDYSFIQQVVHNHSMLSWATGIPKLAKSQQRILTTSDDLFRCVWILLSQGMSVKLRDPEGATLLQKATHSGRTTVLKLIIEAWRIQWPFYSGEARIPNNRLFLNISLNADLQGRTSYCMRH